MTRTTILVDKLIILALHCRMEALIGGNVMTLRSTSMLHRAPIRSTLLLILIVVAAHMRWGLITRPMRLHRVLLLMVQVFAVAHAGLVVEVFGALTRGSRVNLVEDEAVLAQHVFVCESRMEGVAGQGDLMLLLLRPVLQMRSYKL